MRFSTTTLRRFVSFNTFLTLSVIFLLILIVYKPEIHLHSIYKSDSDYGQFDNIYGLSDLEHHREIVDLYYEKRKNWKTSNVGSVLFQNISPAVFKDKSRSERTFVVLIWKYWKWLENRHVNNFKEPGKNDPLSECSVNNCKFIGDDEQLPSADAVVVHIQKGLFPNVTQRNEKQRWILLSDESPVHSFSLAKSAPKMSELANVFNWSMTYRSDSDVPVPYGRTISLQKPILSVITQDTLSTLVPYWENKRRDVLATILISNCGVSRRMNYLHQLEEHLTVDVYGQCSKNHKKSCPGHFKSDCKLISEYLFYLVFENSQCDEYLTEKSFYHAYSKGAIPVILGPTVEGCEKLLPPDSFLHVDNYDSPRDLANHMMKISVDDSLLLGYHRWRNDFAVVNEHGYFGSKSFHLCRVCEALNYNDAEEKVYDTRSLLLFLDPMISCKS